MNIFKWAYRSLRTKGPVQTLKILTNSGADLFFDWRNGTDTLRVIPRDQIETSSDNLEFSQRYKATKARPFLSLLRQLELPRECDFVDIGAGKGRVVLIAAQYGFHKVSGIEFSASLCEIARRNIVAFARRHPKASPMEIVEADATTHNFDPADRVLFMFNPFKEPIMTAVIENIRRSLLAHPRALWLIYNDPAHDAIVRNAGILKVDREYWVGGTEFRVYSTDAGAKLPDIAG
jgi:SAM-dependent methyltransferase